MDSEKQLILSGARELGIELTEQQATSLVQYLDALETTNRSFNLTRIPRHDYVSLHVLDSLVALKAIPTQSGLRILDIGTGAGFPGVPIAAALPIAHVALLDSTLKKVRFAAETAAKCGIGNCHGIHRRAEDLARDALHRNRYDIVLSRAVASFRELIQLMAPFVALGGSAIALKGAKVHEELEGTETLLRQMRCSAPAVHSVVLPGTDIERYLIVVQRVS